ncbi:MAG TPA: hypothetical protein VFF69_16455 [Phycisphaerales bacterium]|nr:hypothetical protein [Phycisphaerales bacterium]
MPQLQTPHGRSDGYSATVRLTLRVADRVIRLGQVGPTWFRCPTPVTIPAGPALLEIEVDGSISQSRILVDETDSPSELFHYDLDE